MINFAVTTDFEVMSPSTDGSIEIDIYSQMIQNSEKLVDIANEFNIKISFMLELVQYERFHRLKYYRSSISDLNDFVKKVFEDGHDIQLHGHSEWITNVHDEGRWHRQWSGRDCVHEVLREFFKYFDRGLDRLQLLLGSKWRGIVFRAGGYYVDPIDKLFPRLEGRGVIADTSRHTMDYGSYWKEGDLIQIPIFGKFPHRRKYRWDLNLNRKCGEKCFNIPTHIDLDNYTPLVMMGHTKMNHDFEWIRDIFSRLKRDERFESKTVSEIALDLKEIDDRNGLEIR